MYFYKMKYLYIARHAKSSWEDFTLPDHDRPVLEKGKKKTEKVADTLKRKKVLPDLIISSTATRARQTALILAEKLGYPVENIRYERNIYVAGSDDIFNDLYGLDDSLSSVMIVGHNPTLTDFVNEHTKKFIDNLPTSAVAAIAYKTKNWQDIATSKHKLKFIITPSKLNS